MTETVFEQFEATARRVPQGGCLCAPPMAGRPYHPEGVEIDYRTAQERVAELCGGYREVGYGPGHRVALLLENRPEFHLHWWALNALGCGIVPINPAYHRDEITYLLDHFEAALVVSVPERLADVEEAVRASAHALPVVDAGALPVRLPVPRGGASAGGAPGIDSEAALLYTSGTTGRPKGCVLGNRYFLNTARWYRGAGGLMTLKNGCERLLNPLPLHHANALAIGSMAMLSAAGCIVMATASTPAAGGPTWRRAGPRSSTTSGSCHRSCSASRRGRRIAPMPCASAPAPASTRSTTGPSRSASASRSSRAGA